MVSATRTLEQALDQYDKSAFVDQVEAAGSKRRECLERFPRDGWPNMALEDYALGQPNSENTFCYWMEFKSLELGSIRGGSAAKLVIFKRKDQPGWYFPKIFDEVQAAWSRLREDFVRALELAGQGAWEEIDELEALSSGPALKLKTLHLYFPDEILPVYSTTHLRRFLRLMKCVDAAASGSPVQLNQSLLAALRGQPRLQDWSTMELQHFLYWWADPKDASRVVKIAPGQDAKYWPDCQAGGYICVGWDKVGDLREFESKESFRERFVEAYGAEYKQRQTQISKKANELWTLQSLEPGDLVVANQGISRVLAIGEVVEPGYEFRAERSNYQHTVSVTWDTSYAKTIPAQKRWGLVTIAKVSDVLLETILTRKSSAGEVVRKPVPVDPLYPRIASALERKGQLILYGPPGTGKTYAARRFAAWWLMRQAGDGHADAVLADSEKLVAAERQLSTAQLAGRLWWVVANPKQWSWDQLFDDGRVEYRYGRLRRNYPLVQRGDFVVGYQSTPAKQVVALARIAREFQAVGNEPPNIVLEPVMRIASGPTYDELQKDSVLATSEPMRFNNQGTLFALTQDEADRLMTLLGERNPSLSATEASAVEAGGSTIGPLTRVTFHPSYTYEDFIEGFRPVQTGAEGLSLRLEDGIFKRICRAAQANPDRPYLLVIDEINRGNVAKILGELLTLLERDKRGFTVALPQSRETFSIPPNVYVLGTMNTADRSIKLLDSALRRRFAFIELMPDVELLRGATVGDLALDDFLDGLNRRIAEQEGREKQIGHSYLLDGGQPISDPEEFGCRFREEILPLLQEYCYDEYSTLAKYIGSTLVDAEGRQLHTERLEDPEQLLAALAAEFGDVEDDQT